MEHVACNAIPICVDWTRSHRGYMLLPQAAKMICRKADCNAIPIMSLGLHSHRGYKDTSLGNGARSPQWYS